MNCRRCPHHVRHGQMAKDGSTLQFKDLCGLKLKRLQEETPPPKKTKGKGRHLQELKQTKTLVTKNSECSHFPFAKEFDYFSCTIYQKTFASSGSKNGVHPTKDIQFSDTIANVAVTDLDFL